MEIKNYFAQDAQGNIMPSANCYLYLPGTTTLATGLVDGNGIPISNPFLASGMGQITFGAPNGVYDLRVTLGARDWTIKVQCADIAQAMDVMDSILGSHAENPTTRNNGQPLEPGDETWNSTDKQPYWWSGTAWVALNSSAQQLEERLASDEYGAGIVALTTQGTVSDAIQYVVPLEKTSAAVLAAINFGSAHNLPVEVQAGEYTGADIAPNKPVSLILLPGAFLNFGLELSGRDAMKSASVTLAGDFDIYPAGTTTFSDNFSAFAAGDIVMVELSNGGSQAYNEAGVDFAVVQSASSVQLVLTTGTRLAYRAPTISKISNAVRFTGAIAKGSIDIPGNFITRFAAGDMIRIENVNGVAGVEGSSFYFEFAKVIAVDSTKITLEARTQASYLDPWLLKVDALTDVSISGGGRVRRLTAANNLELRLDRVRADRQIVMKGYGHRVVEQESRGIGEPSSSNFTWVWNADVSSAKGGGSAGVTDNAALKFMSCPGLTLDGARGYNTKATAQGNYSVYIDFFYTPYRIWNSNVIAKNIRGVTPNGGSPRSVWLTGLENSTVDILGGQAFIQSSVNSYARIQAADHHLELADLIGCKIDADCKTISYNGCEDSVINARVRDSLGTNSSRNVWGRAGTKNPITGASYTIGVNNEINISNLSANAADTTIYLQSQDSPLIGAGCRDKIALLASVTFGSSVTNPRMSPNFLQNSLPSSASWSSDRSKGYPVLDGDYRDAGMLIGGSYLWSVAGGWRTSTTKPTVTASGFPLGQQVAVPASATAAGKRGDYALATGFAYFYLGDNAIHAWQRCALASW